MTLCTGSSQGRSVATMTRPTDSGATPRRSRRRTKVAGGGAASRTVFRSDRLVEQSAVFRHREIEQVELGKNRPQILQLTSGHQHQPSPGAAQPGESGHRGRRHPAMLGQGPVVIAHQKRRTRLTWSRFRHLLLHAPPFHSAILAFRVNIGQLRLLPADLYF